MLRGPGMVARAEVRNRLGALAVLTVTAVLGFGATLGAFVAAYRTQHAYSDYLERANVADLVVNPSLNTTVIDAALRTLPHVRHVWSDGYLLSAIDDGHPRTITQALAEPTLGEVRGSSDGRYADGDRLIVSAGRIPSGAREVFLTDELRTQYESTVHHPVALGDVVPMSFWWALALEPEAGATPNQKVAPIDTEQMRVVGFGRLSDEVLDDDVFPRQRIIVSPDIAARYDCIPRLPTGSSSDAEALGALFPQKCATQYRYYALDVDTPRNVPEVERVLAQRLARINQGLPAALGKVGISARPITTTRVDEDQRVQNAIRPTVVALTLFGALAGIATIAIVAIAVARIMRQTRQTTDAVVALGMSRAERIAALSIPFGPVAVVAVVGATLIGYGGSRFAPVGEVRRVVGHASSSLPLVVVGPGVVAFLLVFAVAVPASAAAASRTSTRTLRRARSGSAPLRTLERAASPSVAEGIRSATGRGRGALLLTTASCVAVAALATAVVFGSNLIALVDTPPRYGWPWDIGVLTNYGYGGLDQARVQANLSARADVESWDELGFFAAQVKGATIPALIAAQDARAVHLPLIDGRLPTAQTEVALGADTADELGVKVGDRLEVVFTTGPTTLRENVQVVGTTVFPSIGQFRADRTSLGRGLFTVVPPGVFASSQTGGDIDLTFVGITLAPGADARSVADALRPLATPWDTSGSPPFVYSTRLRPPEIANAEGIRNGPVFLGALLGFALMIALGLSIAVSVNARRRELALLRALGFTRAQVRRSVYVQAFATVAIGVAVGVPVGIVAGSWGWRVFATDLGVAPDATLPVLVLLGVSAIVGAGALVAAARPAYVAARRSPADVLHAQ